MLVLTAHLGVDDAGGVGEHEARQYLVGEVRLVTPGQTLHHASPQEQEEDDEGGGEAGGEAGGEHCCC